MLNHLTNKVDNIDIILTGGNYIEDPPLTNLDIARGKFIKAVNENKKILVYGDYDMDGFTSMMIIKETLEYLGHENVIYLPYRQYSHSIQSYVLDEIQEHKPDLVIIIDTGSSETDNDFLTKAQKITKDIIVLDHHEVWKPEKKRSFILVNPILDNLPNLCGSCLSFFLVWVKIDSPDMLKRIATIAIAGAYADAIPINSEYVIPIRKNIVDDVNRFPEYFKVLLEFYDQPCARTFGFTLAPKINNLFRTENYTLINKLGGLIERQETLEKIAEEVTRKKRQNSDYITDLASRLAAEVLTINNIGILEINSRDKKFTGLLANILTQKLDLDGILVYALDSKTVTKGSVRMRVKSNIKEVIGEVTGVEAGGHKSAFGFRGNVISLGKFFELASKVKVQKDEGKSTDIFDNLSEYDVKTIANINEYLHTEDKIVPAIVWKGAEILYKKSERNYYNTFNYNGVKIKGVKQPNIGDVVYLEVFNRKLPNVVIQEV